MTQFVIGDVVRVKSKNNSGPAMTVERVDDNQISTIWWNFDTHFYQRDDFNCEVLELTNPDTRKAEEPEPSFEEAIGEFFEDVVSEIKAWFK